MTGTSYGRVEMEGETASIVFRRHLRHPPERVWPALTNSDEFEAWHIGTATIVGGRDGFIEMTTGPAGFHWTGRILAWEPPSVLEYEMNAEPQEHLHGGEQSIVRYELTPADGGTMLTLRQTRLTPRTAMGFAPGTHALLDRLEAYLDRRSLPGWLRRYDEVKAGYPAWRE
jgi:uncharacterized protein YndB with AHSA1/START domain